MAIWLALALLGISPLPAVTVLFLGGGLDPSSGADGAVFSFLEGRYGTGNVTYLAAGSTTAGDEAAYDVLIVSSTVDSSSVRGKFHDSTTPIVNWESVLTNNDQAGEFGVTTHFNQDVTGQFVRIRESHPITAGFAAGELVPLLSGASGVFWSVLPEAPDVTHLAEDDDEPASRFISIVEEGGTLMGGGPAPARRVMFGLKDDTFHALTDEGRALFGQAVDWAAAGGLDPDPPVVASGEATGISFTAADVNGTVVSTGGEPPNVIVYYGDNDGGTVAGNWDDSVTLGAQSGVFSHALFALASGTTYYFRAFAVNGGGEAWAPSSGAFTTLAYGLPALTTGAASNVSGNAAQVGGSVTSTGGDAPNVTVYYGQSEGGTDAGAWDESVALGPQSGEFTTVLSGLAPATTHYYRVFGENGAGANWAETSGSFTTAALSELVINEFMAANDGGATNNANNWWPIANQAPGTTDDWIELHNTGGATLDLAGWRLTDNPNDLDQWTFPPDTLLAPGGFLIVYASGDDAPDANGNLHTNFALAAGGEYVALVRPDGTVASEFGAAGTAYPPQDDDISYGRHPSSGVPVYFAAPTPGAPNDAGGLARVADTKLAPSRGYYQGPVEVSIATATVGATIYFTTDGSPPVAAGGAPSRSARVYDGPFTLNRTTPVRAAAVKAGHSPSEIDTHTYMLLDTDTAGPNGGDAGNLNTFFLGQRQLPGWGSLVTGDYNMDTSVTRSTQASTAHGGLTVAQAMLKGMRDIPTIAISMDRDDFAGSTGIYTNPESRGMAWERACAAEFLPALGDARSDWGVNCGIRVQGGASRIPDRSPKHSLSLRFRAEYGLGKLRENLFPEGPVREFNVISLRAGYNNSWIHSDAGQRERGSMIRDQWARQAMLEMGHADAGRGFMVHLFINGLYWGVHNLCERADASHFAAYNGGDEDALDARNGNDYVDGNAVAWNAMQSTVASRNWRAIQEVVDIDTYIDFQIVNRYGGNADMKTDGNWRAVGGGPYAGSPIGMVPWKLYSWDAERILEGATATTEPLDPMGIRGTLDSIAEYRMRFADRLQKHFFHEGALTPEACKGRWMKYAAELDRAIIAESARWGDHRRTAEYTRNGEWLAEQIRLSDTYFPVRSGNVLARYRSQGFYPSVDAPVFRVNGTAQHGGEIGGGGALTVTATSGTVYYTLDGSDPRREGGAIDPAAIEIASGETVALPSSLLVRVRARSGTTWSALEEATFYLEPLAGPGDLAITEVNYHPAPADAVEKAAAAALPEPVTLDDSNLFEFVEIRNLANHAVNLDGVRFDAGIAFTFGGQILEAGAYAVLVKDAGAFAVRYPGVPIAGVFAGNLANDGERLSLVAQGGESVHDFVYDDGGNWPARADGVGSSLEAIDPAGPYSDSANWRASSEMHGTPGAAGSGPDGRVVINEVLTHTNLPLVDTIELRNTTGAPVDLSGWALSDGPRVLRSFAIPDGTSLSGGGYLVLDESDFNAPAANPIAGYAGTVAAPPATVTSSGHGLATGDVITISGYGGVGNYNGTFEVTVVEGDSFTIETAYLDDQGAKGTWTPGRPFALDGTHGEEVWLLETDSSGKPIRFVDQVSFDAAFEGESLGRWPNGAGSGRLVTMTANSFGLANPGPRVGPVVISEVMYEPASGDEAGLEFVEICNTGSVTENLANWRLRGGADFDFGASQSLVPGGVLVLVAFDPAGDPVAAANFRAEYGIDASVSLAGPFTDGPLRNDTGAVRIQRPDISPADEADFYPGVTEDEVVYSSEAPWPGSAAGGGDSLQRAEVAGFGNFASSWIAGAPNPGGKALDYDSWREIFFGPGEPAGSGPFDDFERDGLVNLVEFALGLNPLVSDMNLLPPIVVEDGQLSLTFTKDTLLAGITCRVEVSDDLVSWTVVPEVVVSTSGSVETRRASVEMGTGPQLFLRLVVER